MIFNPDRNYTISYIAQNEDGTREIVEESFLYFAKLFILERNPIVKYTVRIWEKDSLLKLLLMENHKGNMVSIDGTIYYMIDHEKGRIYSIDYDVEALDY